MDDRPAEGRVVIARRLLLVPPGVDVRPHHVLLYPFRLVGAFLIAAAAAAALAAASIPEPWVRWSYSR